MEATRSSVTSGNEHYYNMEPTYQTGYTQQEVEGVFIFNELFIHELIKHICKLIVGAIC